MLFLLGIAGILKKMIYFAKRLIIDKTNNYKLKDEKNEKTKLIINCSNWSILNAFY